MKFVTCLFEGSLYLPTFLQRLTGKHAFLLCILYVYNFDKFNFANWRVYNHPFNTLQIHAFQKSDPYVVNVNVIFMVYLATLSVCRLCKFDDRLMVA
jgi:hypothetical protein